MTNWKSLTDEGWAGRLTPEQFRVLRRGGTEAPFTGAYWDNHEQGTYACAGCGRILFSSRAKYDSGTGWPSFGEPLSPGGIVVKRELSRGMARDEVLCAGCLGHLGHVFPDGPPPGGLRYCLNSAALRFRKD